MGIDGFTQRFVAVEASELDGQGTESVLDELAVGP